MTEAAADGVKRHIEQVNGRQFRELLNAGRPLLVQFEGPDCEPCRALADTLSGLAARYAGRVNIVRLDVDKHVDLGTRYRIWALPTLLFFHQGRPHRVKARSTEQLDAALCKLAVQAQATGPTLRSSGAQQSAQDLTPLLPLQDLDRRLAPFGRDLERLGIPASFAEGRHVLQGLICRFGQGEAAGLRMGGGYILTNRHVLEQFGGAKEGPAWAGRAEVPQLPGLLSRALPPGLPGGHLVMPWHVGRYSDWALLQEAGQRRVAGPRLRSAGSLHQHELLWIVGGTDGDADLITVGRLKYVRGVNGMLQDCDVRPGMSGAAVSDARGRVVGIFSTQFGWPGRRAMFVTTDAVADGIASLRHRDASLPVLRMQADEPPAGQPVDAHSTHRH